MFESINPPKNRVYAPDRMDVSCVVNLHQEGCLAHRTLRSVERAQSHAQEAGVACEVIVICDKPNRETLDMLDRHWPALKRVVVQYGDPGLSRNHGVVSCNGNYVAFIDGDDLISGNWLLEAWRAGERDANCIMHPQVNIIFGRHQCIFTHPNQSEGAFRDGAIIFENLWTSLSFARRSTYAKVPFVANRIEQGFGFEDWRFNCDSIASGFRHRAVPGTAHFIRAKEEWSVNKNAVDLGLVLSHSPLFEMKSFLSPQPPVSRALPCL